MKAVFVRADGALQLAGAARRCSQRPNCGITGLASVRLATSSEPRSHRPGERRAPVAVRSQIRRKLGGSKICHNFLPQSGRLAAGLCTYKAKTSWHKFVWSRERACLSSRAWNVAPNMVTEPPSPLFHFRPQNSNRKWFLHAACSKALLLHGNAGDEELMRSRLQEAARPPPLMSQLFPKCVLRGAGDALAAPPAVRGTVDDDDKLSCGSFTARHCKRGPAACVCFRRLCMKLSLS